MTSLKDTQVSTREKASLHLNTEIKKADFMVVVFLHNCGANSVPFVVKWSKLLPVPLISQRAAVRLQTALPEPPSTEQRPRAMFTHSPPKLEEAQLRLLLIKTV